MIREKNIQLPRTEPEMVDKVCVTSEKGYQWLKRNIKHKTRKHGQILLYVWYGTCDLNLTSETHSAVEKGAEYFGKIKELVKEYPGCRVTFLEILVYSISQNT